MWKIVITLVWLGALSVMDIKRRQVPIWLMAAGGGIVTVVSVLEYLTGTREIVAAFVGLLPGAALLLVAVATKKAGWADGVVLGVLGLFWGIRQCTASLMLSLCAISVVSLVLLALRRVDRNEKLPYLPFLCGGYLLQTVLGLAT